MEATFESVDVGRRVVYAAAGEELVAELTYEPLVVALGASTNTALIPCAEHALTFKTAADALLHRYHARIGQSKPRFRLFEVGPRLLPRRRGSSASMGRKC